MNILGSGDILPWSHYTCNSGSGGLTKKVGMTCLCYSRDGILQMFRLFQILVRHTWCSIDSICLCQELQSRWQHASVDRSSVRWDCFRSRWRWRLSLWYVSGPMETSSSNWKTRLIRVCRCDKTREKKQFVTPAAAKICVSVHGGKCCSTKCNSAYSRNKG